MKNMHVLNDSELQSIEGGWDKTAYEWGKRIDRVGVVVAGFTPWGKFLRK